MIVISNLCGTGGWGVGNHQKTRQTPMIKRRTFAFFDFVNIRRNNGIVLNDPNPNLRIVSIHHAIGSIIQIPPDSNNWVRCDSSAFSGLGIHIANCAAIERHNVIFEIIFTLSIHNYGENGYRCDSEIY